MLSLIFTVTQKLLLAIFVLVATLSIALPVRGQTDTLDNGLELILVENHSSPMIASLVFIKAGSRYETQFENGISHFLEHLLFDGTTSLDREQLDHAIADRGGYINAFTRENLTVFLVVMPKQFIDYGLTVQADMLFNSVFPEVELVKERQVVIEEIKRSADSPGAPSEAFFTRQAYGETDYGRPILGYQAFIENIPREAIVAYWKKQYTPGNMTALLIGDFDPDAMTRLVGKTFGEINSGSQIESEPEKPRNVHLDLAKAKARPGMLRGQHRYDTVATVASTYINFSIAGPAITADTYLPFDLLTAYLNLDEISPLKKALKSGDQPLATEITVGLNTRPEFTRLEISAITERPETADSIVAVVLAELSRLSTHVAAPDAISGIKTSVLCDAIYYAERLHYYGFIIAPAVASGGWEFARTYPDLLQAITWDQCQQAAGDWLNQPDYLVTVVRPADSTEVPFQATSLTVGEVVGHFDTINLPVFDFADQPRLTYPEADTASFELDSKAVYHREILVNGLTVIIKSGSGSEVFGLSLLGRNRSANEPDSLAGITDFVNRCLEKGTTNRTAEVLAGDLAAIGTNVTLYDNPWIPYDDMYTTRRFAFIKLEAIETHARRSLELLADMVVNPAFDHTEVEGVRQEMLGILTRAATSPGKVARNLFYGALFAGQPLAKPIMGTPTSIEAITVGDLQDHHQKFYSPENMILTVVTNREADEVMPWITEEFGSLAADGRAVTEVSRPGPVEILDAVHVELDKQQVAIYSGGLLPGSKSDETVALWVATSILSERLYENLREKQGLAYSTGAGATFDREFGWYYLTIGTGVENYAKALDGLVLQCEKLAFDGPTAAEVSRISNKIWGRLMRIKLARVNQAYYLAVDEFLGRQPGYDTQLWEALSSLDTRVVRQAASRHFRSDTWLTATAGKKN